MRKHLRRYFDAVLDNEGVAQWFEEVEEENSDVLRDDPAGWVRRERMVCEGVSPTTHPFLQGLAAMAKRKPGAEEVAGRLADGLRNIEMEE